MDLTQEFIKYKGIAFEEHEEQRLAINLVMIVLTHIGMIRYNEAKIKKFDIRENEIGILTDKCLAILRVESNRASDREAEDNEDKIKVAIDSLIDKIDKMDNKDSSRSVITGLKGACANELRKWNKVDIDYSDIWEF